MRGLIAALCATLLLGVPVASASDGKGPYEFFQIEPAMSAWVGKPVFVDCLLMSAYGAAWPEYNTIWLNRRFCKPLSALMGGLEILERRTADGLLALAHEATHLTGVFNEAKTECYAMQKVDDLALHLGAQPAWADRMGDLAFSLSVQFQMQATPYRNWQKCRPQGSWDLSPHDGIWP